MGYIVYKRVDVDTFRDPLDIIQLNMQETPTKWPTYEP